MRVVVTGGAGFIGSHVVDHLLRAGHEVLIVDDLSTGRLSNLDHAFALSERPPSLVVADVRGEQAARAVTGFAADVILLLAAQMSVKVSMRDPLLDAHVNVVGLVKMLEAARGGGCRRAVLATSGGTIYGDVAEGSLPLRESQSRLPVSFYGLTKSVAISYLELYERYFGMSWVSLALGNVYGPRQDPAGEAGVVAIFADRLMSGLPCVVNGDGRTTRDYVHVSDVARAFAAAAERGHGLVNIGSGAESSVMDVHRALCAQLDVDAEPLHGPPLSGEVRRVVLDIRRAEEQLGWRPTIGLTEGVAGLVAGLGVGAAR